MDKEFEIMQKRAQQTPGLMRTNEYIQAKLFKPDLYSMLLEMGPNCNLNCFHCASDNGGHRRGMPNLETVTRALADALRSSVVKISLTFGEPLRPENRGVLKPIGKFSEVTPTHIVTNATFAETQESAEEWFHYLRESGFDFSKGMAHMNVSMGKMYPDSLERCANILRAVKKVLPYEDIGKFLSFRQIGVYEKQDLDRINGLLGAIETTFGKRRIETKKIKNRGREIDVYAYPKKGSSIRIDWVPCYPWGRALSLGIFEEQFPLRELKPENLTSGENSCSFAVYSNGDVSFSDCTSDVERNLPYGNIKEKPLIQILGKIRRDVFFQAYKLGGVALLYHAAQKARPDFTVTGRSSWDVFNAVVKDKKLVREIRDYLTKEGVVDSYKRYISAVDMRDIHLV